ncbi:putative phage tail protein [Fusobacterium massiliense]|uniref:putative phage tail protein n=1 Tax=Fusobacterium massiliense TaxID=1852365 RepID=UPI0028D44586|nr:putative phage tail protein [Fusobacterium massiliense]
MEAKRLMRHMPKYYRGILEVTLLQEIIEKELDTVDLISKDVLNQFFIYTATWSLPIWERIFGLSVGDKTSNIEERRENLISKLRSYGTTTKEMIARVAKTFTNGEIEVVEDNSNYAFKILFTSIVGIPKNIENFKAVIEVIKPAHLNFNIEFRYNTHNQVAYLVHNTLKAKTHKQIYDTRLYNDADVIGKYHKHNELNLSKNDDLKTIKNQEIYDERR